MNQVSSQIKTHFDISNISSNIPPYSKFVGDNGVKRRVAVGYRTEYGRKKKESKTIIPSQL